MVLNKAKALKPDSFKKEAVYGKISEITLIRDNTRLGSEYIELDVIPPGKKESEAVKNRFYLSCNLWKKEEGDEGEDIYVAAPYTDYGKLKYEAQEQGIEFLEDIEKVKNPDKTKKEPDIEVFKLVMQPESIKGYWIDIALEDYTYKDKESGEEKEGQRYKIEYFNKYPRDGTASATTMQAKLGGEPPARGSGEPPAREQPTAQPTAREPEQRSVTPASAASEPPARETPAAKEAAPKKKPAAKKKEPEPEPEPEEEEEEEVEEDPEEVPAAPADDRANKTKMIIIEREFFDYLKLLQADVGALKAVANRDISNGIDEAGQDKFKTFSPITKEFCSNFDNVDILIEKFLNDGKLKRDGGSNSNKYRVDTR